MKTLLLVSAALSMGISAESVSAQETQLGAIYDVLGNGFGPQAFGVTPGRSMTALYGTVDVAVNYIGAGSRSDLRVQSGNDWTSKFGIYGQEDLGAGWTTLFRLESGFTADSGALQDSSSLFNRASFVGLHNPRYGQLSVGKQYSSSGAAALGADVFLATAHESIYSYFLTTSGLGSLSNVDAAGRLGKTVRYISPKIAKRFAIDASYSFKTDQSVGPSARSRGVSVSYADGRSVAVIGLGQGWCDAGAPVNCTSKDPAAPTNRTDMLITSLTQDFGPFVGLAAYIRTAPQQEGAAVANMYTVGVEKMAGANLLRASLAYRDISTTHSYAYGTTLGVDHFLSKRTALYVRAGYLKNGPQSSLTYNYESTASTPSVAAGQSVRSDSIGISHSF